MCLYWVCHTISDRKLQISEKQFRHLSEAFSSSMSATGPERPRGLINFCFSLSKYCKFKRWSQFKDSFIFVKTLATDP